MLLPIALILGLVLLLGIDLGPDIVGGKTEYPVHTLLNFFLALEIRQGEERERSPEVSTTREEDLT